MHEIFTEGKYEEKIKLGKSRGEQNGDSPQTGR